MTTVDTVWLPYHVLTQFVLNWSQHTVLGVLKQVHKCLEKYDDILQLQQHKQFICYASGYHCCRAGTKGAVYQIRNVKWLIGVSTSCSLSALRLMEEQQKRHQATSSNYPSNPAKDLPAILAHNQEWTILNIQLSRLLTVACLVSLTWHLWFRCTADFIRLIIVLVITTWWVAVHWETHCNIRLKSVSHRPTRQVTQLSTYLLTHNLFSSCIQCYLVPRACDWVMPASSAMLLIFSFQFTLIFFNISLARPHQHCRVLLVLIRNIGHRTCRKFWVGTFLVQNVQWKLDIM